MNKYEVKITQHHTFIVEAERGPDAVEIAQIALELILPINDHHTLTQSKNPRYEIVKE